MPPPCLRAEFESDHDLDEDTLHKFVEELDRLLRAYGICELKTTGACTAACDHSAAAGSATLSFDPGLN